MKYNSIIKKIRKYDVVSFDVFDTLIERDVFLSTDIFVKTGNRILGNTLAEEFSFKRIKAEEKARKKSAFGEITLDEIYNQLRDYEPEVRKKLKEVELETELASCLQKKEVYSIFEWAYKNALNVIIISDMYLSAVQIDLMLKKCGYDGYKKIYVSNEYGVNKISGRLFTTVLEDLGISKEKMIHIGDSIKADFIGARRVGIDSVLVNRKNRIIRKLC